MNIREILGHLVGKRVMFISQHDEDEIARGGDSYVELIFEDSNTLKFFCLDSDLYKAQSAFCFSDPSTKEDDGYYHPSEEEAAAGHWAVVNKQTDLGTVGHCVPTFGKHHLLAEECWCNPIKQMRDDDSWFLTHNKEQG